MENMKKINLISLVGKRVLIALSREIYWNSQKDVSEAIILEVSPSEKFIKLEYVKSGDKCWESLLHIEVIEVLE